MESELNLLHQLSEHPIRIFLAASLLVLGFIIGISHRIGYLRPMELESAVENGAEENDLQPDSGFGSDQR